MGSDITRLHHVGHVVDDLVEATGLYERLGFTLPPPHCPAMAAHEDAAPRPFGVANTHADFPRSFVELVTRVGDDGAGRLPDDARLVPLRAPAGQLPRLVERIRATSDRVAGYLDRFEGLHILMFSSPAIDAAADRLARAGVRHGGVNTVGRAAPPGAAAPVETVRYVEFDGDGPGDEPGADRAGRAGEGRLGVVADLDPDIQGARDLAHPNGALELVEAVLCVADGELATAVRRYETYTGRTAARRGPARTLHLDGAAVTVVPASGLAEVLPGERPAALPALVGYTVAVRDLSRTRALLQRNGFPLRATPRGDVLVPAAAALGAAIAFRQAAP
ncbi:VOC family protein [Streptomyces sp. NPDC050585]|uniref:VOC family protein n=1 Tax=Streptomyces sp. NPDC050585 TaxID=3365632 RepID=UPI00379369A8